MIKRIFKNTFLVSIVTMLIVYVIIVGILYDYFQHQIMAELKTEAIYVAAGIDSIGKDYLTEFENDLVIKTGIDIEADHKNRITWIREDGKVLFDSEVKDENLENHKDREEIVSARENGEDYEIRYSNTLGQQTIYYAVCLEDGSVLRISSAYNSVFSLVLAMLQPTLVLVLLIVVVSYFMSKSVAKHIVAPINDMDLTYGEMKEEYEELMPLLKRIRKQNILIDKQMEDLQAQQAKFQALTEHMSEGLLVLDKKQVILSYNIAAVELLGASKDMDYTGQNVISFDTNRTLREAVGEALKGYQIQRTIESGERIYQILANPIVIGDVVRDETLKKQAPKTKKEDEDWVEGVIVIILDETEKEKREQLRREFTSNVSHELKTPLTSISGIAEIMMNGIVKQEDISGFARNIYEEAGRLIDLVNDIIFLSKLDEECVDMDTEQISLRELAIRAKERLKMSCGERNVSIHIVGEEVMIEGISSMVEEIIYNLLDNGIKYNKDGGKVVLTLSKIMKDDEEMAKITVEDTGIGIPQESLERIFERFYRVDKSHSKSVGGTGLGLSIVKHVVLFHRGSISAQSVLGEGTVITVNLPVRDAEV